MSYTLPQRRPSLVVGVKVWLVCLFAVGGLLLAAAALAREPRHVLVLYSNHRLLPANMRFEGGLRETVSRSAEVSAEFIDYPHFQGESYIRSFTTFLRDKYALQPPDVIVVAGEEAFKFLLLHRPHLFFPHAPVVHGAVSRAFLLSVAPLPVDVLGVPTEWDFSGTIELALRWHPRARRLVVVTGASALDRTWEARLREEVSRFDDRAPAEFLAGLPTAEVLRRLGELGGEAVVFTPGYFEDGEGRRFSPREVAGLVATAATAPVYGPFDTFIGTGVVGGLMPSFEAMGRQAGQVVSNLLEGVAPAGLRLPGVTPPNVTVDWRQVRRWDIDERAVPGDAVVHFREPAFLDVHRIEAALAAAVLVLQAGLIAGLLIERRRRRRMELTLQKQRFELAHASRMAVAGELTGAIAHEINQPLGAILSNAEAAELLLASGADRRDDLRAILADIRRDDLRAGEVIGRLRALLARQEVERRPFDLNGAVCDLQGVLRAEARRRGVSLEIRPAATAATLLGDRIQIQQVLLNLVLNAMEAVAGLPEERCKVVVSVERGAERVSIRVRDCGHGIAPEHLPKLFDSFFSTKRMGMGLGLSIARTLVEAHGGRIWAEAEHGEGAVFRVEWPTSSVTTLSPGGAS